MNITSGQRITIMRLWQRVCKDRGWKANDRVLRLATLSELVGSEQADGGISEYA